MRNITPEAITAINSPIKKYRARVKINFSDITLDPSLTVETTDFLETDTSFQLINGNTESTFLWALTDGITDTSGAYYTIPDEPSSIYQVGYWSSSLVAIDNTCNASFSITSLPRNINVYILYFDERRSEYGIDFNVKFYQGITLVHTDSVVGNTLSTVERVVSLQDITKIEVTVTKYNTTGTNVKVVAFQTELSKTFEGSDIINFNSTEESELSGDYTIPTGNISFSYGDVTIVNRNGLFDVNNPDSPLFKQLKPSSKIDIWLAPKTANGYQYTKILSGWTEGFSTPENGNSTNTIFYDRLKRLDLSSMSPKPVLFNVSAGEAFDSILLDGGISDEYRDVDLELYKSKYTIPVFYTSGQTHLEELRKLSKSVIASVFVEDDVIVVKSFESLSQNYLESATYTPSDYVYKDNAPLYDTAYNKVSLTYGNLIEQPSQEIYKTPTSNKELIPVGISTAEYKYKISPCSNQNVIHSLPTGVTVVSVDHFSDRTFVEYNNTNLSSVEVSETITGTPFLREFVKTSSSQDKNSIEKYGLLELNIQASDLVQEKSEADTIVFNLLNTYKNPFRDATIRLNYAGNPFLSLTDKIVIEDKYQKDTYNIVKKEISFDGGVSVNLYNRKDFLETYKLIDNLGNYIVDNNGNNIIVRIPIQEE